MEDKISITSNLEDFKRIFFKKYPQPEKLATAVDCSIISQALHVENWNIAKCYCTIQYWYIITYSTKLQPKENTFWQDLDTNFEQTIKNYETKNKLTWPKILWAQLKYHRSRSTSEYVKKILKALISNNIITLNDTIPHLKIFFIAFDLGAKFQQKQIRIYSNKDKQVIEYTESLEYYIATSETICKSDRIHILEFLAKRGAITLEPSGRDNISTPFKLIFKNNIMALKPFLSHPQIHKLKESDRNILYHLTLHYPYVAFLKNFTLDQLKYLIKNSFLKRTFFGAYKEPFPMIIHVSSGRGQCPAVYLQALKEVILAGDLDNNQLLKEGIRSSLGMHGEQLAISLGKVNEENKHILQRYAKEVRKNEKLARKELISPGDTTFTLEALPIEIANLIAIDLDYESMRSLFSVSKAIFGLKTKFSDRMYNELTRKEFPINVDYFVKGKQGYFDLAKRYTNWKSGAYTVRTIEWAKTKPKREGRIYTMDDNWLAFKTDQDFKLWDCHNDTLHDLPGLSIDCTSTITYLESRPGEVPIVASFDYQTRSILINGRSSQKVIKNISEVLSGGMFVEAIDNDRVLTGRDGKVYSIEKEQVVGRFGLDSHLLATGQCNPFNNLIFTVLCHEVEPTTHIAVFDKNYQNVISMPSEVTYDRGFRFVDEHTVVATRYDSSVFWDLRKSDKPVEFAKYGIERMFGNRYALNSSTTQRQAVIWDLKTGQWENFIILPDEVRYQPTCNSRYVIYETFKPVFCVLDFQF